MTKDLLEQYPDICAEIEEKKSEKQMDVVMGSEASPPYGLHTMAVVGVSSEKEKEILELLKIKTEIESFIKSLSVSSQRRIVYYRAIKKLPWDYVSSKTGYSISQCKRIYKNIFEDDTKRTNNTKCSV